VFSFPGIAAWDESISGVIPNPSQNGITWNADTWLVG